MGASLTVGSVCSGIGAPEVAWRDLGWQFLWQSEIDVAASAVLRYHFPSVPNLGDMTAIASRVRAGEIKAPDVLVGGTPCQSFSVAGLRRGMTDARGNLALSFVDLANAIDAVRRDAGRAPCWILWENVPGVLSDKDNAFGAILGGLVGSARAVPAGPDARWDCAGVVDGPDRCAAWRVLDAQHFGVAQRRRRVFVLARGGAVRWSCADALQPLIEGVRWHAAPRREKGQRLAHTVTAGAGSGSGSPRLDPSSEDLIIQEVANPLGAKKDVGWRSDLDNDTYVLRGIADYAHGSPSLRAKAGDAGGGSEALICSSTVFAIQERAVCENPDAGPGGSGWSDSGLAYTLEARHHVQAAAFDTTQITSRAQAVAFPSNYVVRRLMPVECERLQGFPDGHTAVPAPDRNADQADGPRYKQLGNSMAVPVLRAIGQSIKATDLSYRARAS